jgi:hypothetical protein
MSTFIEKKICKSISSWTGKPCGAKAVNPNTVKKGTRDFLDDNYCQMHQPGMEPKKKCICPHCAYHRAKDSTPMFHDRTPRDSNIDIGLSNIQNQFGKPKQASDQFGKPKSNLKFKSK